MSQTQIATFFELVDRASEKFGPRDAFRIRTKESYRSITFAQFYQDVLNLAAALELNDLAKSHLALIGENSYQWVVCYLATTVAGGVIVPIDKELTVGEISTIISQSESQALFASDDYADCADEIVQQLEIKSFAINCNQSENYTTLNQLIEQGAAARVENPKLGQNEISTKTLSSLVFTSGTTGFSKGVMLSRENLLTNVLSSDEFIKLGDCVLSVLPMHHTYEFTLDILFSIYQGRTIAINNSIKYFAQNIKLFAPTDMLVVPLVAENLYATIWKTIQNTGKEATLRRAIKISNCLLKIGIDLRPKLFKPIHEALGGRLQQFFIGGAYLEPEIARGFHSLGFKVNIGYGITECSPLVTGNITHKVKWSHSCGIPIPGVEIRIKDPNSSGEGEIQVRGKSVMMGYYKNQEVTDAAFDQGWFRTGDIGRLEHGMLVITGRVKNLIVLKNGKNVYPEELESLIQKVSFVKEVVVSAITSDSGQESAIVAEIFPDMELAEQHGHTEYKIEIQASIEKINSLLPYYKRVVRVNFRDQEFPKTTTKKIKRY